METGSAGTSSREDGAGDRGSTKSARDMSSILRCFKLPPVTQRTSHTKTPAAQAKRLQCRR